MKTISLKVTEEEEIYLKRQAKKNRLSVSEYIRRQACRPSAKQDLSQTTICEKTGVEIFVGGARGTLTNEDVAEMLSDFP